MSSRSSRSSSSRRSTLLERIQFPGNLSNLVRTGFSARKQYSVFTLPFFNTPAKFICFRTLEPLALGDEYWNIRDAIVQTELFVLRMVGFQVGTPHKEIVFKNKETNESQYSKLYGMERVGGSCLMTLSLGGDLGGQRKIKNFLLFGFQT